MSESEDDLIEQLRSYGISVEELDVLIRGKEKEERAATTRDFAGPPAGAPARSEADSLGAFDALTDPDPGRALLANSASDEVGDLLAPSDRLDSYRVRDLAAAEAKEAAAAIRASALKLVSEKLQAAEDEVMALRASAAEDAAKLRNDTARAMLVRLQEAEDEARQIRQVNRDESQDFWQSTYREFSTVHEGIAEARRHLLGLIGQVSEAVDSLESVARSIAALSARHLRDVGDGEGE